MISQNKIKDLIILNDNKLIDEKYVYITFDNKKEKIMLFNDAIKFLKKYSISNRFKKIDDLFSSFHTSFEDFESFKKNDKRGYYVSDIIYKEKSKKNMELQNIEKKYNINIAQLANMYWLDDSNMSKKILGMYEKIKTVILNECNKNKINYCKNSTEIIKAIARKIENSNTEEINVCKSVEEVDKLFETRKKQVKENNNKEYEYSYDKIELDFKNMQFNMSQYPSDMFSSSYQLLGALSDKNYYNREQILKNWAEFLIVLKDYIKIINEFDKCINQVSEEKMKNNLDNYYSNLDFINELEDLIDHDKNNEEYLYHATSTLEDGLNVLDKGLFMASDDLSSTTFSEFSIPDILTYEYGNDFRKVGDYIIVIKKPNNQKIVRKTTELEKQENLIMSRRIGYTNPINNYVIEPAYIVGLVDRKNQKIYNMKNQIIDNTKGVTKL